MENEKQKRRDNILFKSNYPKYSRSGIAFFSRLTFDELGLLLSENLIDPKEHADSGPSIDQFYNFMLNWEDENVEITAHGLVTDNKNSDYGIVLEGLEIKSRQEFSKDLIIEFAYLARKAKNFKLKKSYAYCSWTP